MRKKTIFMLLAIMLILIAACRQKAEEAKPKIELPIKATGDVAVDRVGNDISSTDNIEKELGIEDFNDLDSGLDEIQNI